MSRIINELINAFQDEIIKRGRGNNPVWRQVYDDLAGRRGDFNTQEAQKVVGSIQAIFDYYYNTKYPDKDENTVFDYTLEDALAFSWAKTLDRYQDIQVSQQDLNEMDKILRQLEALESELGVRQTSSRFNNAPRYSSGYSPNNYRDSYRDGNSAFDRFNDRTRGYQDTRGRQTVRNDRFDRMPQRYEEGQGRSAFSNQITEEERREMRQPPVPPQDNHGYSENRASDARRATIREETSVTSSYGNNKLDAFVMSPERYHPDVKKNDKGEWIVTTWEASSRFRLHPDNPWRLFADPWTQRLQLVIGEDGFIHQRILELKDMDIEDHKWVIQPKQHRFAKTPSPEILLPLEVRGINEVEIKKGEEVLKFAREIISEYVKAEKLPKNAKTIADVTDEAQRMEIMREANKRLINLIEMESKAKAVNQVKDIPASGMKNSQFRMMEEADEGIQEKIEMNQRTESLPIRSFKDAINILVSQQVNDGLQEGDIVPYEKANVLYRTASMNEYDRIKESIGALKARSKNLVEAYRLLTTEGILPKDLVLTIDHRATQAVNKGLKDILGKDWTITSFVEDYFELSGILKKEVDASNLTQAQFNLFYYYLENEICNVAFPTLESLKQHFNLDDEQLVTQSMKCIYEYDFGTFVYMPFNAVDLALPLTGNISIKEDAKSKITNILSAVDHDYKVVLATKDNVFYQVLFNKEQQTYLLFPINE